MTFGWIFIRHFDVYSAFLVCTSSGQLIYETTIIFVKPILNNTIKYTYTYIWVSYINIHIASNQLVFICAKICMHKTCYTLWICDLMNIISNILISHYSLMMLHNNKGIHKDAFQLHHLCNMTDQQFKMETKLWGN